MAGLVPATSIEEARSIIATAVFMSGWPGRARP
jgi:hypothetical protein